MKEIRQDLIQNLERIRNVFSIPNSSNDTKAYEDWAFIVGGILNPTIRVLRKKQKDGKEKPVDYLQARKELIERIENLKMSILPPESQKPLDYEDYGCLIGLLRSMIDTLKDREPKLY